MSIANQQLIDAAVKKGLIPPTDIPRLKMEAAKNKTDVLDLLTAHGQFPRSALYQAFAESKNIPYVELGHLRPEVDLVKKVPDTILKRRLVLPIQENTQEVRVVCADPYDRQTQDYLKKLFHRDVKLMLAEPQELTQLINQTLWRLQEKDDVTVVQEEVAFDATELLDKLIREAFLRRASDIHIEPHKSSVRIRLRVDGALQVLNMALSVTQGVSIISRIKVLSGLDISEQRLPQDGGFKVEPDHVLKKSVDIRVATSPTRWGERATLRLLGLESDTLTLETLGMEQEDLNDFQNAISRPYGVILLTGPTGSGKTTTLYGALRRINSLEHNIMTIEDPIEYVIEGVNQLQVGSASKTTFASALRSFLRHDPDILMVGEIRDYETADVALKASQTGHLVFSTLHTNSSTSAITRLIDIGCEPYLIASSITGIIAQRLVRKLCVHCRKERPITEKERTDLGISKETQKVYDATGCIHCLGTGYKGRTGIFECLWLDEELKRMVARNAQEQEIFAKAREKGLRLLREQAVEKVLNGVTTIDELKIATVEDV